MIKGLIAPQHQSPPHRRQEQFHVLIVDPDEEQREDMRIELKQAGYQVATAEDAVVAGHRILERAPDLVLCRAEMPYMSGTEFAAALRADPTLPKIAVVLLTKPMVRDELLETVARELELFGPLH
jgi:CheY-like chemotaxis protein